MKKSTIFIVLALLCLKFSLSGQELSSPFSAKGPVPQLEIGAKVPDAFWTFEHSIYQGGRDMKMSLSSSQQKIIVLDFWASWCGTCIIKLPLLDSLKKVYPDELLILPVSSKTSNDKIKNIQNVFNGKLKGFGPFSLPTVVNDSLLRYMFPHHVLPHIVWIQDGKVLATTSGDFISAAFIDRLVLEQRKARASITSKNN